MGSACTPWVRPIMIVSLWARAFSLIASMRIIDVRDDDLGRLPEPQREGGIDDIVRGEPEVDILPGLADGLFQLVDEGRHVVFGLALDLIDAFACRCAPVL